MNIPNALLSLALASTPPGIVPERAYPDPALTTVIQTVLNEGLKSGERSEQEFANQVLRDILSGDIEISGSGFTCINPYRLGAFSCFADIQIQGKTVSLQIAYDMNRVGDYLVINPGKIVFIVTYRPGIRINEDYRAKEEVSQETYPELFNQFDEVLSDAQNSQDTKSITNIQELSKDDDVTPISIIERFLSGRTTSLEGYSPVPTNDPRFAGYFDNPSNSNCVEVNGNQTFCFFAQGGFLVTLGRLVTEEGGTLYSISVADDNGNTENTRISSDDSSRIDEFNRLEGLFNLATKYQIISAKPEDAYAELRRLAGLVV